MQTSEAEKRCKGGEENQLSCTFLQIDGARFTSFTRNYTRCSYAENMQNYTRCSYAERGKSSEQVISR